MGNTEVQSQAVELVSALEKAWARDNQYNLSKLKKFPACQAILKNSPAIQVAVSRRIIEVFATFGKQRKGKNCQWNELPGFPWGCLYFLSSLLKKPLPFTNRDFEDLFANLSEAGFVTAIQFEFVEPLFNALEKHAASESLSPRLRKLVEQFGNMLAGEGCSILAAADRKVAAQSQRILEGALTLG